MSSLNELLFEKMSTEYEDYINSVKSYTDSDAVIRSAYEITMKSDILVCFENENILSDKECRALLKRKCPLDILYNAWLKSDFSHMDMLRECISDEAKKVVKEIASRNIAVER